VRTRHVYNIRRYRPAVILLVLATTAFLVVLRLAAQTTPVAQPHTTWVAAGSRQTLAREMVLENAIGRLGILNYFDFDNDFFSLHVTVALTNLAKHVADTKASRVEIRVR
jgi:hypothetical protein